MAGPLRLLLLGSQGQVGWELQRALAPLGAVTACTREQADLSRPDMLPALVERCAPDVIVNAAAYTAVDKAESDVALARTVNAEAPAALARLAAARGALLVHYSTDYVFDGSGDAARDETAPTAPLNVYGHTKLEGERAIQDSGCRHLILRTSWVHASRGGNFAKTMLRLAADREALNVIADQIGAPTGADLIADVTAHAISRIGHDESLTGLYHLVASGETSWHEYARFVIALAHAHGLPLKTQVQSVAAIGTADYPTPARRPLNSRLDTRKLRQALGLVLPPWQAGVERMLTEHLGR